MQFNKSLSVGIWSVSISIDGLALMYNDIKKINVQSFNLSLPGKNDKMDAISQTII